MVAGLNLDDAALERFYLDAKRPAVQGVCPFCGGTIVMGFRKDTANLSLGHSAVDDPLHPGFPFAGCVRYVELVSSGQPQEFLRLLKGQGFRFQPLVLGR